MSDARGVGQWFRGQGWTSKFNRRHGLETDEDRQAREARDQRRQFGWMDLGIKPGDYGRTDFARSLETATGADVTGPLRLGRTGDMLEQVNMLAKEWGMTPFASLNEVTPEFIDRLEALVGTR